MINNKMKKIRHMLNLKEFSGEDIEQIINNAIYIKQNSKKFSRSLENKSLIMIFQKTSTRTRISFEAAMTKLGGHAIFVDWNTTQFSITDLDDEIKSISRYGDIFAARMKKHSDLLIMAKALDRPLINLCCEKYHPCQILGDLMTIKEKKKRLKGLNLTYFGISNNISNSLTIGCTKTGINFTLCSPERHPVSIDKELLNEAYKTGLYKEVKDPFEAIQEADLVYTDSWIDMELFKDPKFKKEKLRRIRIFHKYQLNKDLMSKSKALIMHNMPIHPGYEITKDLVYDKRSIIFDQAENRLHIQKSILLSLLNN